MSRHRGDTMTEAERAEARARAVELARAHREQRAREQREHDQQQRAEQQRAQREHVAELVPEPRREADPADPEHEAAHPDTGDPGDTRTHPGSRRPAALPVCCPDCLTPLPRRPRHRQDGRCESCRTALARPRPTTRRERYDALVSEPSQ